MRKRVFSRWATDPDRLAAMLAQRLDAKASYVHDLIEAGAVYVNAARAAGDMQLTIGDKITVFLQALEALPPLQVVHRDGWIIVVDKPAGLPSQAERGQRTHALDSQVQRGVDEAARLVHRLDKEASGLVLFSRRQRANAPLQAALAAGEIDRRYVAIVDGELRGEGHIRLRIGRHPSDPRLRSALPENAPAGQRAHSRYRTLAHAMWGNRPITAVELQLDTGRTHQLRVHLSAIGHTLVGDAAYDGPPFERLCLHAHTLTLPHPENQQELRLQAPLPEPLCRLVPRLTSPFA